MANVFDRFDGIKTKTANPFDQFDDAPSNNPADYPQAVGKTDAEKMRREFVRQEKGNAGIVERLPDAVQAAIPSRETVGKFARPILEGTGAALGGIAGIAGGAAAGLGVGSIPAATVGGVAGSALGFAGGATVADMIEGKNPETMTDAAKLATERLATGATYEMGGQAVAPVLGAVARGTGAVIKPVLGRLSRTGTEGIEQALKSGENAAPIEVLKPSTWNVFKSQTAYDRAMRGKMTGEEVVDTAKGALNRLKDERGIAYRAKLAEVEQATGQLNIQPVTKKIYDLADQYNVKIDPVTLAVDESRIAMGKTGRKDVAEIFDLLKEWGKKPEDMTATGLDTLKRQLDDFYSDSSQARQFVASLKDTVKNTISDQVPAYGEMTKGYAQATGLIKDIEAGLMLRKQGMTGRITSDQTLKRLQLAMRDDGTRKELVQILGSKGGADLEGAIAGYSANQILPAGMSSAGMVTSGGTITALSNFVNPAFAGVVLAASPRAQGEFLRIIGRARGFDSKYIEQTIRGLAISNRPKTYEESKARFNANKLQP